MKGITVVCQYAKKSHNGHLCSNFNKHFTITLKVVTNTEILSCLYFNTHHCPGIIPRITAFQTILLKTFSKTGANIYDL